MTSPKKNDNTSQAKKNGPLARSDGSKKGTIEGAPRPLKVETKSRAE